MALQSQKERYLGLIKRPVVTEKSTTLQGLQNRYTFEVADHANKSELTKAIESLFEVKVEAVNIMRVPGKMRRVLGRPGKSSAWKKAIVHVAEGDVIDLV